MANLSCKCTYRTAINDGLEDLLNHKISFASQVGIILPTTNNLNVKEEFEDIMMQDRYLVATDVDLIDVIDITQEEYILDVGEGFKLPSYLSALSMSSCERMNNAVVDVYEVNAACISAHSSQLFMRVNSLVGETLGLESTVKIPQGVKKYIKPKSRQFLKIDIDCSKKNKDRIRWCLGRERVSSSNFIITPEIDSKLKFSSVKITELGKIIQDRLHELGSTSAEVMDFPIKTIIKTHDDIPHICDLNEESSLSADVLDWIGFVHLGLNLVSQTNSINVLTG
eukprot:GHVL01043187.1.p1 GENE.GHVL01043187.1~~GHVL01043187.1.p1  ORF type:complete len:282 (-),score=67.79 GHVL01043187.1:2680-3525(-)